MKESNKVEFSSNVFRDTLIIDDSKSFRGIYVKSSSIIRISVLIHLSFLILLPLIFLIIDSIFLFASPIPAQECKVVALQPSIFAATPVSAVTATLLLFLTLLSDIKK